MALIKASNKLLTEMPELYDIICDFFDSVKFIKTEINDTSIFRVEGIGIPKDDVVIDVIFYQFEGITPFVIEIKELCTR